MRTLNFLSGDTASFTTGLGDWIISGASAVNDTSIRLVDDLHTIVVTPDDDTTDVILSLSNIVIPVTYADKTIQFHIRAKSERRIDVVVELTHNQTLPAGYSTTRFTPTRANSWTVCRSNALPIPDIGTTVLADIQITIDQHEGDTFNLTLPFLYGTFDVDQSFFSISTYAQLPQIFASIELAQLNENFMPELPTLRLIECGHSTSDEIFDEFERIQYLDTEYASRVGVAAKISSLVTPEVVDTETAEWLAQFLGFSLDSPQQTTTPWGGLPNTWHRLVSQIDTESAIDTDFSANASSLSRSSDVVTATFASAHSLAIDDLVSVVAVDGVSTSFSGTFTVTSTPSSTQATWAQTGTNESASKIHTVALLDTEWTEIEEFNPDVFDRAGYTAWQLNTAYSGIRAGTLNSLVNAIKFNLSGDKIVTLEKNHNGDPWQILVKTKTSETPGGSTGNESEIVINSILPVKPIGYKITHTCTVSGL